MYASRNETLLRPLPALNSQELEPCQRPPPRENLISPQAHE